MENTNFFMPPHILFTDIKSMVFSITIKILHWQENYWPKKWRIKDRDVRTFCKLEVERLWNMFWDCKNEYLNRFLEKGHVFEVK